MALANDSDFGLGGSVFTDDIARGKRVASRVDIDDENLSDEGRRYGDAGIRPQVVWANGVLASTAVGLAIDSLNGWTRTVPEKGVVYLSYDGNTGLVFPTSAFVT